MLLKQFWYIIFHSARPISSQRLPDRLSILLITTGEAQACSNIGRKSLAAGLMRRLLHRNNTTLPANESAEQANKNKKAAGRPAAHTRRTISPLLGGDLLWRVERA